MSTRLNRTEFSIAVGRLGDDGTFEETQARSWKEAVEDARRTAALLADPDAAPGSGAWYIVRRKPTADVPRVQTLSGRV